ncbi:MAG: hypothetical protein H6843_06900 [Rhodospirillaceae bacterium]|nr:hypothetical protein [Rhodospirillaceae bacterium]
MNAVKHLLRRGLYAITSDITVSGTAKRRQPTDWIVHTGSGRMDPDDPLAIKLQELYGPVGEEPPPERLADIVRRAVLDAKRGN